MTLRLSLYLLLSTSFSLTLSFYTSYFRIQFYSFVFSLEDKEVMIDTTETYPPLKPPGLYYILISWSSKVKKSTPKNHYLSTQSHKYRKEEEAKKNNTLQ